MKLSTATISLAAVTAFSSLPCSQAHSLWLSERGQGCEHDGFLCSLPSSPFDLLSDIFTMPLLRHSFGLLLQEAERQDLLLRRMEHHQSANEPRHQVMESKDFYDLILEVPGMGAEDLNVSLESNSASSTVNRKREDVLRVSGTRRFYGAPPETEEHPVCDDDDDGRLVADGSQFDKMFVVPSDANVDEIEVSLSNGLLRIRAPRVLLKKEDVVEKKLEIVTEPLEKLGMTKKNGTEAGGADKDKYIDDESVGMEEVDGLIITEEESAG